MDGARNRKAFDWLVLILAVIAAALCQFPELYPLKPYEIASLTLVRVLVFPMVVLATVWLWSYLSRKMEYKIVLKSFAWIYASFILTADIMLLLLGTVILLRRAATQPSPAPGSPWHINIYFVVRGFVATHCPHYFLSLCCLTEVKGGVPRLKVPT